MKMSQVTKYAYVYEIRIYLVLIFEFAKLPDNNIDEIDQYMSR